MADTTPKQRASDLRPEHIAFAGEARDGDRSVLVLCWPTLPAAWSMLAQAAASLLEIRKGSTSASIGRPSAVTHWMQGIAPRLSQPIAHDPMAGESTLAALVRRLPIRMAVAVTDYAADREVPEPVRCRDLFGGCLAAYEAHLKASQQAAARVVMVKGKNSPMEILYQASYQDVGTRLATSGQVSAMELRFWKDAPPLSLEAAELAATAAIRYLQDPEKPHPLMEAIKGHAVPFSRFYESSAVRKKRR
jgi:hypothetical protein